MKKWMALFSSLAAFLAVVWWFSRTGEVEVPTIAQPAPQPSRPPPPPPRDEFDEPPPVPVDTAVAPPPAAPDAPVPNAPIKISTPRPPKNPLDPEAAAREQALLERARQQVVNDPETALRSLMEYRKDFPGSEHLEDAELLRLEAFLRLGKRQEAEDVGRKLTKHDPSTRKAVDRLLTDVQQN